MSMIKNLILAAAMVAALSACGKRAESDSPAPKAVAAAPATTAPLNEFTTAKGAAALFRASPNIEKVCWVNDGTTGGFLVMKSREWFMMVAYNFHGNTANQTFYHGEIREEDLVKVFPDLAGADCKTRAEVGL